LIWRRRLFAAGHKPCEAQMVLVMRRIAGALLAALLTASTFACKSPPPHTDSTKGTTKQERSDTGMHDPM
jgi:hypothetical protein